MTGLMQDVMLGEFALRGASVHSHVQKLAFQDFMGLARKPPSNRRLNRRLKRKVTVTLSRHIGQRKAPRVDRHVIGQVSLVVSGGHTPDRKLRRVRPCGTCSGQNERTAAKHPDQNGIKLHCVVPRSIIPQKQSSPQTQQTAKTPRPFSRGVFVCFASNL